MDNLSRRAIMYTKELPINATLLSQSDINATTIKALWFPLFNTMSGDGKKTIYINFCYCDASGNLCPYDNDLSLYTLGNSTYYYDPANGSKISINFNKNQYFFLYIVKLDAGVRNSYNNDSYLSILPIYFSYYYNPNSLYQNYLYDRSSTYGSPAYPEDFVGEVVGIDDAYWIRVSTKQLSIFLGYKCIKITNIGTNIGDYPIYIEPVD